MFICTKLVTANSYFLLTPLQLVLLISEGIGMNCHRIDLRFRGRSMLGINFNFFERVKGVETVDQFSKYGVLKCNLYISQKYLLTA